MENQPKKQNQFSINDMNNILSQTTSIKKKLKAFIARFKQHPISQIFDTLNYLHQCMTKPNINLQYKFNSMYVLRALLESANYVIVNWIEVFFLPHILQIAKFYIEEKSNGKDYFLKQGYIAKDSKQELLIVKYSYNYTFMATQMIQLGAFIKPYRLFKAEFTKQKSDFVLALQELKVLGFKPRQGLQEYDKSFSLQKQIAVYRQNLWKIEANMDDFVQKYKCFSGIKLKEYLQRQHVQEQQEYKIDIIQIYEGGDLFLISCAIQTCQIEIKQPKSMKTFSNSLNLFHRLMIAAEYEAFYVLNYGHTLDKVLVDVIQCDKVEKGVKRGQRFFYSLQNSQESAMLYNTFLDYLQKWSLFARSFVPEEQNTFRKAVMNLGQREKIQLPQTTNLEAQYKSFQANYSQNEQRNYYMVQYMKNYPFTKISQLSHYSQLTSKITSLITQNKTVASKQYSLNNNPYNKQTPLYKYTKQIPFIKQLTYVQAIYRNFWEDQQNYQKNKTIMENYVQNLDEDLYKIPGGVFDQIFKRICEKAFILQKNIMNLLKNIQTKASLKKIEQPQPQIKIFSSKDKIQINYGQKSKQQSSDKNLIKQPQNFSHSRKKLFESSIDNNLRRKVEFCRNSDRLVSKRAIIGHSVKYDYCLEDLQIGKFYFQLKQQRITKKNYLCKKKLNQARFQTTPWIAEKTKDGRYVWRGDVKLDKTDVKTLLKFIFAKRKDQTTFDCPSVFINAGSHGNACGQNAFDYGDWQLSDDQIFDETVQTLSELVQSGDLKLSLDNIKRTCCVYLINSDTPCKYPVFADHIIDTQCLGAYQKVDGSRLMAKKSIIEELDLNFLYPANPMNRRK